MVFAIRDLRMGFMYFLIGAFSWFIVYGFTTNLDHDVFLKQAHFHELGIQIQHMHEKLYAKCPKVFQPPDSASVAIIGRRRSLDASLDLKIELAEKTLEDLIQAFGNCTGTTPVMTLRTSTGTLASSTEDTTLPTTTAMALTSTESLSITAHGIRHAFQVLRSKNVTSNGYRFLLLEVRVPTDGLSRSSNWCLDYQYLCQDFHGRPTGCGVTYSSRSPYSNCRDKYNSDMNIGNVLGCNPSTAIARLANTAFPILSPHAATNYAFGFHQCASIYCSKTINGSENALIAMEAFRLYNVKTFYTVCR